jgi:hypothetical protein
MLDVSTGFMPGVELSARLYDDAVRPLLLQHFPGLAHTAALIGAGSEVLGFDTERSTDHDWGPRLHLFLHADDITEHGEEIGDLLAERMPATIAGYPTNLVALGNPGTRHMRPTDGRIQHGVVIAELGDWLTGHPDPDAGRNHHRGGLPRRAGPPAPRPPPAGLVPRRSVALHAGLPVATDQPRRSLCRPVR